MTLVIAGVVVVVIVVVILALALTGVIPGLGGSNKSGSSAQTFSQSMSAAQSAANGQGSGYTPIYADGFTSTTAVSLPAATLEGALSGTICTFSAISTVASFSVPSSGNLSLGTSADWLFLMHNSTKLLVVVVASGSATVLGSLTGSTCVSTFAMVQAIPTTVVDSSTASLALDVRGGYAFLKAHPTALATDFIFGPVTVLGHTQDATWDVGYAACDPSASGTSGPQIDASVDAQTGAVNAVSNTTVSCGFSAGAPGGGTGGGGSLASDLSIAPANEQVRGTNYWYNFSVQSASSGLTWGDLLLEVQTASGSIVTLTGAPGGAITVIGISGNTVASYSIGTYSWTTGGSLSVSNQDEVVLQCTNNLQAQGDSLTVLGIGSISGSISAAIP